MKNVLLTSLGFTRRMNDIDYYHYQHSNSRRSYCNGISVAEAGTKYLLSRYPIDEILVLGSEDSIGGNDSPARTVLKDRPLFPYNDYRDFSEYGFYCYRIQQYLDGLDIEISNMSELFNKEGFSAIKSQYQAITEQTGNPADAHHFEKIDREDGLYRELVNAGLNTLSEENLRLIKHWLYSHMDSHYKMHPLDTNLDVSVEFCPVEFEEEGRFSVAYIRSISEALSSMGNDINLYVDLQGLSFSDAFSFLNMIEILQCTCRLSVRISAIIQSDIKDPDMTHPID